MSINLLKKSMWVYKPILYWNILLSLIIGLFLVIDGAEKPGGYIMAIIIKPIGWAVSIVFEKLFLRHQSYFYKNMGLSFRKIFLNIIVYDIVILITITIICLLCRNFLLTVLPTDLINKRY